MHNNHQNKPRVPAQQHARPNLPYWENPVYQFVARSHRIAQQRNSAAEMARLSELMQRIVDGKIQEHEIAQLDAEREAAERAAKAERKRAAREDPRQFVRKVEEDQVQVNVKKLKERIFNPHTSLENAIKCLDMLPKAERIEVTKKFSPYFRSRFAKYLQQHNL